MKFDKVIVFGSFLPKDFNWSILLARDQVSSVLNEYGQRSYWCDFVNHFVAETGCSGRSGYECVCQSVRDVLVSQDYADDTSECRRHIQTYWVPYLRKRPSSVMIRNGSDIQEHSDFDALLNAAHRIDDMHYSSLEHYREADIPRGMSLTWIEINPDIYTFLVDREDGKLKGYINAMPLEEELIAKLKRGTIRDNEVTSAGIIPFQGDQCVKLYLMPIALHPSSLKAAQGLFQESLEKLLFAFFDKLIRHAMFRRIRVTEIVAIGWTGRGKRLCEWFGMKRMGSDQWGHPVYRMNLDDVNLRQRRHLFPGFVNLLDVYQKME